MERPLKERLIGAAVLVAAAIILIPEMLSGPDRDAATAPAEHGRAGASGTAARGEPAGESNNAPIKTYTIDLSQSPGTSVEGTVEERAPPPDESVQSTPTASAPAPTSDTQANPEPAEQSTPAAAEPESSDDETATVRGAVPDAVVEPPTQRAPAAASSPARPLASVPAAPTSSGWAVQLGSFSKQSTAERLAQEMRAQGHGAFVMPVKSGAATLYRVRIGPMKDRASAEAALRSVKSKAPGAALVAHP